MARPESESPARYGAWIRAARERKGLTMEETVRRVVALGGRLTSDGLSRIERNINGARLATLEMLAEVYGEEIGDLLPHTVRGAEAHLAEPLLAALAGLSEEEIEAWVNQFAQVASVQRSFLERRLRGVREITTPPPPETYTRMPSGTKYDAPTKPPGGEAEVDGRGNAGASSSAEGEKA